MNPEMLREVFALRDRLNEAMCERDAKLRELSIAENAANAARFALHVSQKIADARCEELTKCIVSFRTS